MSTDIPVTITLVLTTEDIRQHGVSHDGLAELHPLLVVEVHQGVVDGYQSVWPGETHSLVPPSLHHIAHVETQQEGHLFGHRTEVLVEVVHNLVEFPPADFPENKPGCQKMSKVKSDSLLSTHTRYRTCRWPAG